MALRKVAPSFFRRPDDEAAFERLYERHVEGVYRYAVAMLGDAADAEDVTQTTFLNAYRAFKSGTRPEKPNSWLIAIAHNVCRQRFRQAQRRPREVAFDERIGDPEVVEPSGPTAEELRRALSELPPNQRAALVMRELEGCSYAEIANVLGVSVAALEALLFRARRALREQLEEQISCDEAAVAINRQLDGRLSLGERRALRAHLRACAECNSLAQSQRAQRRALKSLVFVPLPLTIAHWSGAQTASAATGAAGAGGLAAVGATTGGASAGASSVLLGGAAAKVAAVVAAGVVVGGGTYEGVRHVAPSTAGPQKRAAVVAPTSKALPVRSSRSFETPKVAAPATKPAAVAQAHRAAALRGITKKASAAAGIARTYRAKHVAHVPPGQAVKAIATTQPHSLRSSPPGRAVSASRASAQARSSTHPQRARAPSKRGQAATHRATPTNVTRKATTPPRGQRAPVKPVHVKPVRTDGKQPDAPAKPTKPTAGAHTQG